MNTRKAFLILVGILSITVVFSTATFAAEYKPRFTWPAFRMFWNKYSLKGSEIQTFSYQNKKYIVPFGPSTQLVVHMDEEIIESVEARFVYATAPNSSGKAFKALHDSVLRVGTFRWPQEHLEAIQKRFDGIKPAPISYRYSTSYFERALEGEVWRIVLRFMDNPSN